MNDSPRQRTAAPPGRRIGFFAVALAAIFALALLAGSAFETAETGAEEPMHGSEVEATHASDEHSEEAAASAAVPGLASADESFALELGRTDLARDRRRRFAFRVVDRAGEPVTEFDTLHARRMHLVVVREDGTGFQHLHPRLAADGTWSVGLRLADAGTYRAYADFSVAGTQRTLAARLDVPGRFEPRPVPEPVSSASAGPYDVDLDAGELVAGSGSRLRFTVVRDGESVDSLEPYLGAAGHLVALRESDLAYLHAHPEEAGGSRQRGEIPFEVDFPTPGRYLLYLQFADGTAVRTAEYTVEVAR